LGAVVWPAAASAQGCAATACRAINVVRATVGTIMRLTVNGATTIVASPSPAAYAAGQDAVAGPTAVVKSNGRWKLQISAAEPTWDAADAAARARSEEHTSELQSRGHLVCRLLLEKKKERFSDQERLRVSGRMPGDAF